VDHTTVYSLPSFQQFKRGELNHISDIKGVQVGHQTYVRESTPIIQTGLTAILINPKESGLGSTLANTAFWAASVTLGGNGELSGQAVIHDFGLLNSPIMLTNTTHVGTAIQGVQNWMNHRFAGQWWLGMPVVGECWDGFFNTINNTVVANSDVEALLEQMYANKISNVTQGRVGAGRGMRSFGLHGGIGSASRQWNWDNKIYTVGVLLNANHSQFHELSPILKPVLEKKLGSIKTLHVNTHTQNVSTQGNDSKSNRSGSIVVVIATDAPLLPHQLRWLAQRATLGLAAMGSQMHTSSGDFVLAFTTANPVDLTSASTQQAEYLSLQALNELSSATTEAIVDAHIQALLAANQKNTCPKKL
jgi:L-aminopeptidase/D-esterase-like protein